jgi:anti-sigma-K factor RskA
MNDFTDKDNSDQALWEAFQYVSGELSMDQALSFEQRLETDALLCEAVVQATQLSAAARDLSVPSPAVSLIGQGGSRTVTDLPVAPVGRRVLAVACSVTCCCLLLALAISPSDRNQNATSVASSLQTTADSGSEAEEILTLWNADAEYLSPALEDPGDETAEMPFDTELDVPAWMIAAVNLEDAVQSQVPDTDAPDDFDEYDDMELF